MRLWISKNSEVPIREQLATQLLLAVLGGDLPTGGKLPSTRELARRLRIHANTVSAVGDRIRGKGVLAGAGPGIRCF